MKTFLLVCLLYSFSNNNYTNNQSNDKTDASMASNDSSNYVILPYDTGKWYYVGGTAFQLTPAEIVEVDTLLHAAFRQYNKFFESNYEEARMKYGAAHIKRTNFVIDLERYKRQYLSYIDSNGHKIVHVNCVCNDAIDEMKAKWKENYIIVSDGGNCFFNLNVNLSEKKCKDLMVNGDA